MTDGKSLKTYISEEKAKWSSFNKEQKIQYFKDYYLIKSVLLLLAIVMITSLLCETVFLRKEILRRETRLPTSLFSPTYVFRPTLETKQSAIYLFSYMWYKYSL